MNEKQNVYFVNQERASRFHTQGIADLKSHLISDKHCKAVSGAS